MNNAKEYYKFSELSFAAYSDLYLGMERNEYEAALRQDGNGMSPTQAQDFASKWQVIDQYTDLSGVSATVFEENATGKRYLAIRGTESPGDINADYILALGFPSYLNPQFVQLQMQVDAWLANGTLSSGFSVAGHSLGGYLAAAIGTWNSTQIDGVFMYNAPGLGGLVGNALDAFRTAFGFSDTALVPDVTNIRGSAGLSIITGLGAQLAPPVLIETEFSLNPINNHSIVKLTDSLAVYDLFFRMDETLAGLDTKAAIDFLEPVFKAGSANDDFILESLVNSLGRLFVNNYQDIAFTSINRDGASDEMFSRITKIIAVLPESGTSLLSIAEASAGSLANLAKVTDARGTACRYALQQLNPFIVVGADYSRFNQNGELDRIDPDTGTGSLSDSWITDRSAMLTWVMKANIEQSNSNPDNLIFMTDQVSGYGWDFIDRITGKRILVSAPGLSPSTINHKVIFGGESTDHIEGATINDRLYGGGGADIIQGKDGDDFIEGGKGNDRITGGKGYDWLYGGEGIDTYEYNIGDGNDIIIDSDNKGKIIIHRDADFISINTLYRDGENEIWTDATGKVRMVHDTTWKILLEDGGTIQLGENFKNGDFGIHLTGLPIDPASDGKTISGDLAPIDFDPIQDGVQMEKDALGNIKCDPDKSMPGRSDYLHDNSGDERIEGKDGNDFIYQGLGSDWVLGGEGRDGIGVKEGEASGNDIVEGGAGADVIYGGDGNDQLFGQEPTPSITKWMINDLGFARRYAT